MDIVVCIQNILINDLLKIIYNGETILTVVILSIL